jgi:3-phenylpropionate/trans-cinnamate dioxygenase ferredoxin reductase subunit
VIVRGDPSTRKFSVFHLSGNKVQAVEAINAPQDFMVGRSMLSQRRDVDPARLSDASIPIKEV